MGAQQAQLYNQQAAAGGSPTPSATYGQPSHGQPSPPPQEAKTPGKIGRLFRRFIG